MADEKIPTASVAAELLNKAEERKARAEAHHIFIGPQSFDSAKYHDSLKYIEIVREWADTFETYLKAVANERGVS